MVDNVINKIECYHEFEDVGDMVYGLNGRTDTIHVDVIFIIKGLLGQRYPTKDFATFGHVCDFP